MDPLRWLWLAGGLFLGLMIGRNDGANVFGPAVGTRMLRFLTAAALGAVFATLGALLFGEGPARSVQALGPVSELPAAFVVSVAAGYAVLGMNRRGLLVSTSQTLVGAVLGYDLFIGHLPEPRLLLGFFAAWALAPLLAGVLAVLIYLLLRGLFNRVRLHLFTLDLLTRYALVLAGALGALALGANNAANAVGVFLPHAEALLGHLPLPPEKALLALGGLAIGLGFFGSERVMRTVGRDLARLNPLAAWAVAVAQAAVLLALTSPRLSLPPVPVSSSQAVIGAVVGLGLLLPGSRVDTGLLARLLSAWVLAPALALVLSLVLLFVARNVFELLPV